LPKVGLSQNYENKSFTAFGLMLPKIKKVLPTNLPKITATELRADNVFLLEDDRILIVEYESSARQENFIKYMEYVISVLRLQFNTERKVSNIIVAVVYTGDIKEAPNRLELDCFQFNVMQVFLSNFNTDELYADFRRKVEDGEKLSDEDVMKFIDKEYSNVIKGWIAMTKVARLFEEEKIEAVNHAVNQAVNHAVNHKVHDFALKMLSSGEDYLKVMDYTGLTKDEVLKIHNDLLLPAANQ
jgi:hypothetical protein